jgi:hypothetical protein
MWYNELFYRLAIFNFKDVIEILSLSSAIYFFSIWLKQDQQKPLVLYFYSACSLFITAHILELNTLTAGLNFLYPSIIMLFIIIHQKSLQKSFVTLKNIQPAHITNQNWLETLLRSCIIAANNKQPITCLIEGQDRLIDLVHTPIVIKSKLEPGLLDALIHSTNYDCHKMIWLSNTGILLGINTDWLATNCVSDLPNNYIQQLDLWQKQAIVVTMQTDATAFRLNPTSKTFDIINGGKLIEKVAMDQAIILMKKYFTKNDLIQNRDNYEPKNQTENQTHKHTTT